MEDNDLIYDVAVHEMGHALGFISDFWERPSHDLVAFNSATDPRFTGTNATTEYNTLFGVTQNGVPLQSDASNVAGSHWRESVLGAEIMTPFANPAPNPLSGVTIAAMQDLGYTVNMNARDNYTPGQGNSTAPAYSLSQGQLTAGVIGTAQMAKTVDTLVVVDPTVFDSTNTGNSGNGINFSINNSNMVKVLIEDNNIHDNTGEGVRLITPQFRTQGVDAADMVNVAGFNTIVYSLNTINNNGGHGINMILDNGNRLDTVICVNDISGNELGGINVELTDNAYYDNGTFDGVVPGGIPYGPGNSFSGNTVNDNGGIGYSITAKDNSQFELIGSSPVHSTINRNQEAGIGIVMTENTVGTIELDNITIDGNMDSDAGEFEDVNKLFDGDGFGLIMSDNALVNNLRIGSNTPPSHPTSISETNETGFTSKQDSILSCMIPSFRTQTFLKTDCTTSMSTELKVHSSVTTPFQMWLTQRVSSPSLVTESTMQEDTGST